MLAAMLLQKQLVFTKSREKVLKEAARDGAKGGLCRTCLSTENLRPLFRSLNSRNIEMSYKLHLVTGLKIEKDDKLSQKICTKCLRAIEFALQFRFQSQQAQETLQKILHDQAKHEEEPQVIKATNTYPFYEVCVKSKDEDTDNATSDLSTQYPFDVKIKQEPFIDDQEGITNDQFHDSMDSNDVDSENDLKPLNMLKKEIEPTVVQPIITIKKIPKETSNITTSINVCSKPRKSTRMQENAINKTKRRQDRINKVRTFIKVENLPEDWFGSIKPPTEKKKRKIQPRKTKDRENEKSKDPITGEEVPVLIKVANLPEDMDKVPMPKVPRPDRRIKVPDGPPYKCSTCDKEYMKRPMYLAHIRFHTHFHVCEQCGKRCKNPSLLRTHQRAVHGAAKVHVCSQCDYSATTRCALIVHERRHKDERPFVCDHCGAAFFTRRTLAQHIGVHMPANIQCPHCPKKCKSMKLLSNHRARKHARRYIYHCPVCPKQFNDNNAVHKHLAGYHGMPREQHPTIEKQLVA